MSSLFETFLKSIPKNRSDMVNELDIPEDITVSPFFLDTDPDDVTRRVSRDSAGYDDEGSDRSDSSLALSRAMTDSEIDYEMSRRYKARRFSQPWNQLRLALDAFPPGHLTSLDQYIHEEDITVVAYQRSPPTFREQLMGKMTRFFEECKVFEDDDPGLLELEEALEGVKDEMTTYDLEIDSV